jgi:hypothetical protein
MFTIEDFSKAIAIATDLKARGIVDEESPEGEAGSKAIDDAFWEVVQNETGCYTVEGVAEDCGDEVYENVCDLWNEVRGICFE